MPQRAKGKSSDKLSKEVLQAEVIALREENKKLKAEVTTLVTKKEKKVKTHSFWRATFAGISATIAVVAFMLFNVAYWTQQTIIDNEQFVATVSPIIEDPAVQETLTTEISNQIFSRIDIEQELKNALPDNLDFIAAPFADQVQSFTTSKISDALQSPQVANAWTTILGTVHEELIAYIQNPSNDAVITVDEVYTKVGEQLTDSQIGFLFGKNLPSSIGSITVKEVAWLPEARQAIDVLQKATQQLAIATIAFTALAIGLSRRRGSMIVGLLSFSLLFMGITLVAIKIGSWQTGLYVADEYSAAAVAIYDIITKPLVEQTVGFALLFSSVLAVMLVTSSVQWVVWLRAKLRAGLDWLWSRFATNLTAPTWLAWIAQNRVVIGWTLLAVLYVAFALRIPPTKNGVLTAIIASTIAVFVLEVIASFCRIARKHD